MRKLSALLVVVLIVGVGSCFVSIGKTHVVKAQDGDCPENPWGIYPAIGDLLVVDEPEVGAYNRIDGRRLEILPLGSTVRVISSSVCDDEDGWVEISYQNENFWVVYVNNPTFSALSDNRNTTYYLLPHDYSGSVVDVTERNERCPLDNLDLDIRPGSVMVVDEPNVFSYQLPYGDQIDRLDIGTAVQLTQDMLCYDTELWTSATLNGEPIWVKLYDNNTRVSVTGGVVITYHFMPEGDPRAEYQGEPINSTPGSSSSTQNTENQLQVIDGYTLSMNSSEDGTGERVATLEGGDIVTVLQRSNSGNIVVAQVRFGAHTGWVLLRNGNENYFEPVN